MAPYVAEMMTAMAVPAGAPIVPMVGQYIPSIYVSKTIELGVTGVSGLNLFFGFKDVDLFLERRKELGAEAGNMFYDGLKEWTDILAFEINVWVYSIPGCGVM